MSTQTKDKQVHVADVVRHGTKLILPEGMQITDAIDVLQRRLEYEDQVINHSHDFECFFFDGAHALAKAMESLFGWSRAEPTRGMFGGLRPPQMINVEIGYRQTTQVPLGRFQVPNVSGHIETNYSFKHGRVVFSLSSTIKRKDLPKIQVLIDKIQDVLDNDSIYRGKAFELRFRDDDGNPIQFGEPRFLDMSGNEPFLIFNDGLTDQISSNVFVPITRTEDCRTNGIPLKRGILMSGTYGVGKTLVAKAVSFKAVKNGWTYIYLRNADELPDAISFAKNYSPAVIFTEDIDKAVGISRTEEVNNILNTLDGIDSKDMEIMVVLTTNNVHSINPAMFRPGRLDAVIEVTPPNASSVEKLIRLYGGEHIGKDTDLSKVSTILDGQIPAVIREVVERAKLYYLNFEDNDASGTTITEKALEASAENIKSQVELLKRQEAETSIGAQQFGEAIGRSIAHGIENERRRLNIVSHDTDD